MKYTVLNGSFVFDLWQLRFVQPFSGKYTWRTMRPACTRFLVIKWHSACAWGKMIWQMWEMKYYVCKLLNCWRIKDQLNVTCYFISLLMCSTCFRHKSIHHQEFATILLNYHIGRIVLGSMCVGVSVRLGWSGIRAVLQLATRIPLQTIHTETPTHIEPRTIRPMW